MTQLDNVIEDIDSFYELSGMRQYSQVATDILDEMSVSFDDDNRRFDYIKDIIENKVFLDFGFGHGGVLQRAKKKTRYLYGVEPENVMRESVGNEIVCFDSLNDLVDRIDRKIDVITLFHVLEHLQDPIGVLRQLSDVLGDDGKIIIEVPNVDDALLSLYQSEEYARFTYWVCHLFYFSEETLGRVILESGLRILSMEQVQRYPLCNHLFWITQGNPGGHKTWSFLRDNDLDKQYGNRLARIGKADTIIAVISV